MKKIVIILLISIFQKNYSQELFVVTDPASNIPADALNIRLSNSLFKKTNSGYNYNLMPEVTYGFNKNLMVRVTSFLSNNNREMKIQGGSLYTKYRFHSTDDLNSHFRMALYGRFSLNKSRINQEQIEIMGQNSGFEAGIVATKLLKKVAISSSISYEKAIDNKPNFPFPNDLGDNATNYTLSFGKLMYPKKYTNFKQTNINLMVEFIGQTINGDGKSYLDVVPAIQFIFNSQARLDLAYRQELANSMLRTAPNGFYLNFEYNFFNFLKK